MTLALHGKSKNRQWLLGAFALLAVFGAITAAALGTIRSGSAASVTPTLVPGNPTCQDLGYLFGFKPNAGLATENDPTGTFPIGNGGSITIVANGTGITSFVSTLAIDAVIVKGGNAANVYEYDPAVFSDTDLITPDNASGGPAGLSHVVFCFNDPNPPAGDLDIEKDAELHYDRACTWDVEKSATEEQSGLSLAPGAPYTIHYTVTVTGDCQNDESGTVTGTITVTNIGGLAVEDIVITDTLTEDIDCGAFDGTLDPGEFVECTYTGTVAIADGTNSAAATGTDTAGNETDDTDAFDYFDLGPDNIAEGCITLNDTNAAGPQGALICAVGTGPQAPAPWTYSVGGIAPALNCQTADPSNTATITGDEDEVLDSDTVVVHISTTCVFGKTMGFWGNRNGIARISVLGYPANAVNIGRGANVDTQAEATKILPNSLNACGKGTPSIFTVGAATATTNCTLAAGVNINSLNTLSAQTLALGYNIKLVTNFSGQTLATCDATRTVNQIFAAAVLLIDNSASGGTTTQAQIGAMNTLLGCVNAES